MINYQDFSYNGSKVTFSIGEQVYVNATKMAKVFGKRPVDWIRLSSTKEFLSTLSEVRNVHITRLVITKKGQAQDGGEQGTWMHRDVAIEFARWLSPQFAIWCNDRIIELLTKGKVALSDVASVSREDAEMIGFAKACIDTDIRWSFRRVANRIITNDGAHLSRKQLIYWLRDNGYLCDSDEVKECPTQWAIDMGYMMIQHPSVLERKDRAMKKRMSKGYPTPLGAMHLINLLTRSLPKGRGRVAEQKQLDL